MKNEDETVRQKYREHLAVLDFHRVREYAQHMLKKGWHTHEMHRRGASVMQQTAFTTALVVTYCRPFNRGVGWKKLDIGGVDLSPDDLALHEELKVLRNEVHAHTDHVRHDRAPWVGAKGSRPIHVITAPPYHLTKDQLERIVVLLNKLIGHFSPSRVIKRQASLDNET
jgi:hypothetical protein